jgi:hypothetical protein
MGQYWRIQREIALEEGLHEEASAKEKGVAVSSNKMIDLRKEGDSRASNRDAPSFGRKKKK